MSDLSGFFPRGEGSDWQHSSDDKRPSSYTAVRIEVYQCGKCRTAIEVKDWRGISHWPVYCAQGHRNEKPE
jgi:hypothetical protein